MPYLVSTSFDRFLENITIAGDLRGTANGRRDAILELLKDKFSILDIFPTGSTVRGTGLKGISDVDVMLVLHYGKHVEGKTPVRVLEDVRAALSQYNAQIVKKNGQAVTLYFKTWPNVDIVPAKRVTVDGGYMLQIPDASSGGWIPTNPAAQDRAMASVPLRRRQLVRMVKRWNASHSGYFQSFHIEQVALGTSAAHDGTIWNEASWPWAVHEFFEKAIELTGPSAAMSVPYTTDDWSELRSRLAKAKEDALSGWYAVHSQKDVAKAVERYRVMFGDNFPAYG